MTTTYQVTGLDSDGCTVVSREAFTLKAARKEMQDQRTDESYIDIVIVATVILVRE